MSAPCPACGAADLRPAFATQQLRVSLCRGCGHAVASHAVLPQDGRDYHDQLEGGAFLDSLHATRQRQAKLVLERLRRLEPGATRLLDLGCGRGWFVEAALAGGFRDVAGADTSAIAVESARRAGAHGMLLEPSDVLAQLSRLPFRPEVVTLLDVLEHFEGEAAVERLAAIVELFKPELRLVAIKVPVSSGILYRSARVLHALGAREALEQLYQVGTNPPHLHYFTAASLKVTLRRAGLEVVEELSDLDFEPSSLVERARAARHLPRPMVTVAGRAAATAARFLGWQDALVVFGRPLEPGRA